MKSAPQIGKKFYFFDYFYILLKSASLYSNRDAIFESFRDLSQEFNLGDSKYRKLTKSEEEAEPGKKPRLEYTFQNVISESNSYNLISVNEQKIFVTERGLEALKKYQINKLEFNWYIFQLMETKLSVFRGLVELCYKQNKAKGGLLIFPTYSPKKLGFDKSMMTKNKHIFEYSNRLKEQLTDDIKKYTKKTKNLDEHEKLLLKKLVDDGLLSNDGEALYNRKLHKTITLRFRKFWLNYFLEHIYGYRFSFTTFNIWAERGKQLGLVHTTDFYPDFDGRLVYPTSIIVDETKNKDFKLMFEYPNNEKLYMHKPDWDGKQLNGSNKARESFVDALVESYFDLRRSRRTHFIQLSDLREKVCYKMRIPSFVFDEFLEKIYTMNLKGEVALKVQISLEVDKLPQETNAIYLKREPVLINGKYKNIITIDYKKNIHEYT